LVFRLGIFDAAMDHLFGPEGPWSPTAEFQE
jgi:hypothetical protein